MGGKMHPATDMTGQRFGRLLVITRDGSKQFLRYRLAAWSCRCDCGALVTLAGAYLRNGTTRSCGCLSRELTSKRASTHGMCKSQEYRIWLSMKARCSSPICNGYKNYGGRGIKVCDRWALSFENFYEDMGIRLSAQHSLDRIDVNGDYEPGNVVWATMKQQNRHRRYNRVLTVFGETRLLVEWLEQFPINRGTFDTRIRAGWPIETALTTPPLPPGKRLATHKSPIVPKDAA